jgi:hypothetical protein
MHMPRLISVLVLILLLHPTFAASQSPECTAVSKQDASVLDKSWDALARSDFATAQNALFYFGNDLTAELRARNGKDLDSSFVWKTHDAINKHLQEVQHVVMWQQITVLKAKLELARIKGTGDIARLSRDFDNFKTVYCLYYRHLK